MSDDENMLSLSKNLLQMKFMKRIEDNRKLKNSEINSMVDDSEHHVSLLKSIPIEEHWYFEVAIPKYISPFENIIVSSDNKLFDNIHSFGRISINGYNSNIQKYEEYHNQIKCSYLDVYTAVVDNNNNNNNVDDISDGEMANRISVYTNKKLNNKFNKTKKAHKVNKKKSRKRKLKGTNKFAPPNPSQ